MDPPLFASLILFFLSLLAASNLAGPISDRLSDDHRHFVVVCKPNIEKFCNFEPQHYHCYRNGTLRYTQHSALCSDCKCVAIYEGSMSGEATADDANLRHVVTINEQSISMTSTDHAVDQPQAHDYALVCETRACTSLCQKSPFGYYCKSNGALDNTGKQAETCDFYCECHNLDKKTSCITNLWKVTKCWPNPQAGALLDSTATIDGAIIKRIADIEGRSTLTSSTENPIVPRRNDYAVVCETRAYTSLCQKYPFGYYCKSNGVLDNNGPQKDDPCDYGCGCQNLSKNTNCITNLWKVTYCWSKTPSGYTVISNLSNDTESLETSPADSAMASEPRSTQQQSEFVLTCTEDAIVPTPFRDSCSYPPYRYYCSDNGKPQFLGSENSRCNTCTCKNRFPCLNQVWSPASCIVSETGEVLDIDTGENLGHVSTGIYQTLGGATVWKPHPELHFEFSSKRQHEPTTADETYAAADLKENRPSPPVRQSPPGLERLDTENRAVSAETHQFSTRDTSAPLPYSIDCRTSILTGFCAGALSKVMYSCTYVNSFILHYEAFNALCSNQCKCRSSLDCITIIVAPYVFCSSSVEGTIIASETTDGIIVVDYAALQQLAENGTAVPDVEAISTAAVAAAASSVSSFRVGDRSEDVSELAGLETPSAVSASNELEEHHSYYMTCASRAKYDTCSNSPNNYYCNSKGEIWRTGSEARVDPSCTTACKCQALYVVECPPALKRSIPLCGSTAEGTIATLPDLEVVAQVSEDLEDTPGHVLVRSLNVLGSPLKLHDLEKRHSYALTCHDRTGYTYCTGAEHKYYCTASGNVLFGVSGGRDKFCDKHCKCTLTYNMKCPIWLAKSHAACGDLGLEIWPEIAPPKAALDTAMSEDVPTSETAPLSNTTTTPEAAPTARGLEVKEVMPSSSAKIIPISVRMDATETIDSLDAYFAEPDQTSADSVSTPKYRLDCTSLKLWTSCVQSPVNMRCPDSGGRRWGPLIFNVCMVNCVCTGWNDPPCMEYQCVRKRKALAVIDEIVSVAVEERTTAPEVLGTSITQHEKRLLASNDGWIMHCGSPLERCESAPYKYHCDANGQLLSLKGQELEECNTDCQCWHTQPLNCTNPLNALLCAKKPSNIEGREVESKPGLDCTNPIDAFLCAMEGNIGERETRSKPVHTGEARSPAPTVKPEAEIEGEGKVEARDFTA